MVGFLLFMGVGEALESRPGPRQPLAPITAIGFALMATYGIGLALALRWERIGAACSAVALGSIFVRLFFGMFPGNLPPPDLSMVLNPFMLALWVPIVLYWRSGRQRTTGGP
jgi:hypothetical protein